MSRHQDFIVESVQRYSRYKNTLWWAGEDLGELLRDCWNCKVYFDVNRAYLGREPISQKTKNIAFFTHKIRIILTLLKCSKKKKVSEVSRKRLSQRNAWE